MLTPALSAERFEFQGLNCYVAGQGAPLLLLHSVNAAASAAEVRPLFEHSAGTRPVMALELPGFGSSQRDAGPYTPALMRDSILRALAHLKLMGLNRPVDLLSVSLSCEFATLAALQEPSRIRSLALVSPTGLESEVPDRYEDGRTMDKPWLRHLLERGPWADALYRLLTREGTMRAFLRRTWGSHDIDERLLAYHLLSVRQPGARHAPYAFIAGALFTRGIARLYGRVQQPVWLARGLKGGFSHFEGLAALGPPAHWTSDSFDAGALPYFECPDEFMARYAAFLAREERAHRH
jgi:pimeloyl-ACP methyl ester carboxylesterase